MAECELRSLWRGVNAVDYVPKVRACLETPGSDIWFEESVEKEVLELINSEREAKGLAALALRSELVAPTRIHSFDMAQEAFFAHEGPDGRVASQRVSALDRTLVFSEIRENIATIGGDFNYYDTARILHRTLMDSDGHRANILAPNVTHVGLGVARQEKGAWITQVFVRAEGELEAPLQTSVSVSEPPEIQAELIDWDVNGFALRDEDGLEYNFGDPISDFRKDFSLVVLGERVVNKRRRSIIKLFGPSTTPVP